MKTVNLLVSSVALASLASALSGCAPAAVGGAAVGGAVVATDRRTSSDLLDDQGIELRASRMIHDLVGGASHINVTSWNGRVLLSGEVPAASDRQHAEQLARSVAGVREVINDLGVMPASSLLTRTQDTFLTGMVKTSLASNPNVAARDVKVVTERSAVYLMGRVTPAEAAAAAESASQVSGVQRVVRVFEYGVPSAANPNTNGWFSSTGTNVAPPVVNGMPDVGQDGAGNFYQSTPLNTPVLGSSNANWYPPYPDTTTGTTTNLNNTVLTAPPVGSSALPPGTTGTWYTPAEVVNGAYTAPPAAAPYPYTVPSGNEWTAPPAVQDLTPLGVQTSPVTNSPLR